MNTPKVKKIVSKKRVRNFIAKKLREEPKFKQQRIEGKKPEDDANLKAWLLKDEY